MSWKKANPRVLLMNMSRRRSTRHFIGILFFITLIGFGVRAKHRHHPMRCNEAAAFIHYGMLHSPDAWFNYSDTHNHILHTILVDFSLKIKGIGPMAVRTLAFLAGLAIIPAGSIFAWARPHLFSDVLTGIQTAYRTLLGDWSRDTSLLFKFFLLPRKTTISSIQKSITQSNKVTC